MSAEVGVSGDLLEVDSRRFLHEAVSSGVFGGNCGYLTIFLLLSNIRFILFPFS